MWKIISTETYVTTSKLKLNCDENVMANKVRVIITARVQRGCVTSSELRTNRQKVAKSRHKAEAYAKSIEV